LVAGLNCKIWYQGWAKSLFTHDLLPGIVVSHQDTPDSNRVLDYILKARCTDLMNSQRPAMVVASNTQELDVAARVSSSGANFYPLRSKGGDLRGAVSSAVMQVVSPLPSRWFGEGEIRLHRQSPSSDL
jgi:hypothetical protein